MEKALGYNNWTPPRCGLFSHGRVYMASTHSHGHEVDHSKRLRTLHPLPALHGRCHGNRSLRCFPPECHPGRLGLDAKHGEIGASLKKIFTIAIDGPVGAGKSTVADAVAQQLGILHLDTGAMYRALALHVLSLGINVQDEQAVIELIQGSQVSIDVVFEDGAQRTLLNGQDVSTLIRTQEVGNAASTISRYRLVRQWLVERQQALATQQSMLLDGRDIGTVVLPQADVKVFLTASPETRAQRRYLQLLDQGQHADFDDVFAQLYHDQDQTRSGSLRQAEGAVLLDTTHDAFEQSVKPLFNSKHVGHKSSGKNPFYSFARIVLGVFFALIYPVRAHNREKLDQVRHYHCVQPWQHAGSAGYSVKYKRHEIGGWARN